ncbi:hypothetical protein COLO4_10807 [Corchorus olitorius]|uniref:Uncharacterized protein n=1 Tax=Corchorus olitorius TaxID=93759 RepID=A0A1R3K6V3_9ROSI|nr:hypothetical protein COLO4_10807 [Corchorus olitorius]
MAAAAMGLMMAGSTDLRYTPLGLSTFGGSCGPLGIFGRPLGLDGPLEANGLCTHFRSIL